MPNTLLQFIRRLAGAPAGGPADHALLERFIADHDEAAFTALLQRHAPMVWSVCWRILGNAQDAEDAFQATFLILARKAGSVRRPELLGNWLYGIAYRTALKARARAARMRSVASNLPERDSGSTPAADTELKVVLDEEISGLPDKYRVPFVLCYLNGMTNEEAARTIGCPKGTVQSRLARARERLRARLTRRGLDGLAIVNIPTLAQVPRTLMEATVRAAFTFLQGGAILRVSELAEGVIQTMLLTKLKMATAVIVGIGMLLVPATIATRAYLFAEPAAQKPAGKAEGADRVQAAQAVYKGVVARWQIDPTFDGPEKVYQWSRRWMEAQQALGDKKVDRIAALKDHLQRMKELRMLIDKLLASRNVTPFEGKAGEYYYLEAQEWLQEAQK